MKQLMSWPLHTPFGAEPNDGDNNDGSGDGQGNSGQSNTQDNQGNSSSGGTQGQSGAKGNSSSTDDEDDEYKGLTPGELRRLARDLTNKAKTAEKERDSFKTKVDEEERKTRTKEENLERDVAERDSTIANLRATNAKLAIVSAILKDSRYEWNDVEIVAQQLNSEVVKVNDGGAVEGLKKELERVAKEHAFLLKAKGTQQNNGPTGFQPGQGGGTSGTPGQPDVKELTKHYPALANRL